MYFSLLKNLRIGFMAFSVLLWNAILGTGIYIDRDLGHTQGNNTSTGIAFAIACIVFTAFFVSMFYSERSRNISLRPGAQINSVRRDLLVLISIMGALGIFSVIGWLFYWPASNYAIKGTSACAWHSNYQNPAMRRSLILVVRTQKQ